MQYKKETFDNLIAGLSLDERVSMLHQMKGQIKPEIQYLQKETRKHDIDIHPAENLKKESILLKFIIYVKAIFSNKSISELYTEIQLGHMTKKTSQNYPEYFNAHESCFEKKFYFIIEELQKIADFFKPSIIQSEAKQGDFFILLGSLILTDLEKRIEEEANPYINPFADELPNNLRISLFRKLEGILADVSSVSKERLYTCIKSLFWLKDFCDLPFGNFLSKFSADEKGRMRCSIRSCPKEIEVFAQVLCNARNIEAEIIEALYLFSVQKKLDRGETIEVQNEIQNFMNTSLGVLKSLVNIINLIPFESFYKLSKNSITAEPIYNKNVEDWYVTYKDQWKKRFDKKWEEWLKDRIKALSKKRISNLCNTHELPLIPNRPWEVFSNNFQKNYTIGFLYVFFEKCYPKYHEAVKLLLMEGEFIIAENKAELMDIYTELKFISQKVTQFNDNLSSQGQYGASFKKIQKEHLYTMQGKALINNLFLTLVAEVDILVLKFMNVIKAMQFILDGILIANYNTHYDGITNITRLFIDKKTPLRILLSELRNALSDSLLIINDLASIEIKTINQDEK